MIDSNVLKATLSKKGLTLVGNFSDSLRYLNVLKIVYGGSTTLSSICDDMVVPTTLNIPSDSII